MSNSAKREVAGKKLSGFFLIGLGGFFAFVGFSGLAQPFLIRANIPFFSGLLGVVGLLLIALGEATRRYPRYGRWILAASFLLLVGSVGVERVTRQNRIRADLDRLCQQMDFRNPSRTREVKACINGIGNVPAGSKYRFLQSCAAQASGQPGWNCPALEGFFQPPYDESTAKN